MMSISSDDQTGILLKFCIIYPLTTSIIARNSLILVVESCKVALIAIDRNEPAQDDYPSSDFPTLRKDFLSLLSLIHASSTKVALALKPSAPQHKAALTPLKDLSDNVAALVHSIRLMRRDQSATILKEYTSLAKTVIEAVESLAQMFLDSAKVTATEEYLVRTGTVHNLIDMARKPGGLSLTSRDAVRKMWMQNHESIVDGAEEIQRISSSEDPEGDFIDDGWEELGINSTIKLSPAELDRTEKVGSSSFPFLNNGHPQFMIHLLGAISYQVCSIVTQTSSSRHTFSRCP